jgi:predicted amidophosphoribosyltransferase
MIMRTRPPARSARQVKLPARCGACGEPSVHLAHGICLRCVRDRDDAVARLGAYLDDHPEATLRDAGLASGLAPPAIAALVAAGRLRPLSPGPGDPACDLCGAPVPSGRFCPGCRRRFREHAARRAARARPRPR